MVCVGTCKWFCILAYVLASLGSLVLYAKQVAKKKVEIPDTLVTIYAIGALYTLYCSVRWTLAQSK